MGLILPAGPSWRHYADNLTTGTPSSSTLGTAVTPGTGNVKGSTVQLLSALAFDAEYLRIGLSKWNVDAQDASMLVDIMYDPAGGTNWQVLIPNLLGSYAGATISSGSYPTGPAKWYEFPLWVPAGSTLGARVQRAGASTNAGAVYVLAAGGNANPGSWWCGQRVTAIAINEATSRGQTHAATSSAFSSWANLGAALTEDCGALQFGIGGEGDADCVDASYQWKFGIGGSQLGPTVHAGMTGNEASFMVATGIIWARLPAGTQLQVCGRRDSFGQPLDVAAWVVS